MQRERAEPAARDLLLELAAGADEDRRGARLVDRDARAGDLRARRAPERDQLAGALDDGDHDAVAVLARVPLGGVEHGLGAGFVDDLVRGYVGHESGSFRGQFSDPDRRVGGDEQQVAFGPAEAEVHGAGQADLADQLTAGVEHLDAGERRGVDAPVAVDLQPVGKAGRDDSEQPLAGEARAAASRRTP